MSNAASGSSRGGRGHGGGRGGRGRGRGRGASRGATFGGSLSDLPSVPRERGQGRSADGKARRGVEEDAQTEAEENVDSSESHQHQHQQQEASRAQSQLDASLDSTTAIEGESCFICAEPVKLYSIPPCNHKTCHICAIRLRVLYKKHDCTFCKAPSDNLIFTTQTDKDYLSFNAQEIPFKDDRLNIHFETEQNRDETLVLLHFNCPDPTCDFAGASWPDLKAHVRSEHGKLFCDLCVRNSRIFVHEHTLHTSAELTQHIRTDHKHCEFCRLNFYSDDELYVHMRDRHEQCFICKRHEDTRDDYHRDYPALEKHFKQRHYLCESKQCLEQKFVVFESEMDFKAHQVAEHGTELSSREKREALRVTANFEYHPHSNQARTEHGGQSSSGYTARGQRREEPDSTTSGSSSNNNNNNNGFTLATGSSRDRDPLGVSALASRSHVPGAGGAADHRSRRAQFGSGLTSAQKIKEDEEAAAHRAAEEDRLRRNQIFTERVAEIVRHSEVKMHSFRTNLKTYQAGEMSARDLIGSLRSIVDDSGHVEEITRGIVNTLESHDKRQELLDAWTTVQVEQTHFPSLGGSASGSNAVPGAGRNVEQADLSTISRGQVRSIKNSSVAANRGVWANVERAAASGGSVYRNVARSTVGRVTAASRMTTNNFPSLGANKSVVPGSAVHSARANAGARAATNNATPWASSSASATAGRRAPPPVVSSSASAAPANPKPFSVNASQNAQARNQTSIRSNSSAFPALPLNADATRLAAQKKALFEHKRNGGRSGKASGSSTPNVQQSWSQSGIGRIDGGGGSNSGARTPLGETDLDIDLLNDQLNGSLSTIDNPRNGQNYTPTGTPGGGGGGGNRKNKQKNVLVSMGGVHRG